MKRLWLVLLSVSLLLSACSPVDLAAPVPSVVTGIDPNSWAQVPSGDFYYGQYNVVENTSDYEIMVTDVTTSQYADYLNAALLSGTIKIGDGEITGYYPGDTFTGKKHEERIDAGDWLYIPLNDPSQHILYDGTSFSPEEGYEDHPMTMVTWFGARGYCEYYGYRLPTEKEWEKAARGTDTRAYPWGDEIQRSNANFYASRDPFEDMKSFGSRTTPVGFFNGTTYLDGYVTLDSRSPYGLFDMAGNVWQWTADVYPGMHYRMLRGGSKDTYEMDLRIFVRNNATPTYFSPGVGFRCVK
jgi:formylglycine-generating enzyme required for sulfatase activity